ncbi:hypothetical protein R1flu_026258 [Riccia fluitans]|uniref:Fe2OG dioxygenase domain-containing protein n=1 Tax=Riccia fluitans TaxID=41844 RepID=A0ABD1XFF4_9MARC
MACDNSRKLPLIDLSGLEGPERGRIGKQILEACETWGFFQCINHGVDKSTQNAVREACLEFFKLSLEEKRKWTTSLATFEGYSNPKHKENTGKLAKTQEGVQFLFNLRDPNPVVNEDHERLYPSNPPTYKPAVRAYFKESIALEKKLLAVLSEALGLEADALMKGLEGGAGEAKFAFRSSLYIPESRTEDELAGIGLPPHTDTPSMLTLLFSDDVPGLEIEKDNEWVKVDHVPDSYIVNVGDPLEVLTNGRLKSVEHRAYAHTTKERFSCIVITIAQEEAKLGPLPQLIDAARPALYETRTMAEFMARLTTVGYGGKSTINFAKRTAVPVA